jgi:hypothetical protein
MTSDPKGVVARFYELVNAGTTEKLDEICAPDLRGHAGAGADLAQLKQSIAGCGKAVDASGHLRLEDRATPNGQTELGSDDSSRTPWRHSSHRSTGSAIVAIPAPS